MTMQPIKNEQAVTSMASVQSSYPKKPLPVQQHQTSAPPKAQDTAREGGFILTGVISAQAKNTALAKVVALQEVASTKTVQAKTVRTALMVDHQLDEIKKRLLTLVKNYPPFPKGDDERVKYLMSIDSFRKQIEQMTNTPPEGSEQAKKIWTDMFAGLKEIPALVPSGPEEADDNEIAAALSAADSTQKQLRSRGEELGKALVNGPGTADAGITVTKVQDTVQHLSEIRFPLAGRLTEGLKMF